MDNLKTTIMRRDGITSEAADELIAEAREEILNGADPEEILDDYFGLEPDYLFDII